ncbi:hypothetical protein OFM39_31070, partial [Escherichia coli]|nr:hypothetical protein [Escherichia coli]
EVGAETPGSTFPEEADSTPANQCDDSYPSSTRGYERLAETLPSTDLVPGSDKESKGKSNLSIKSARGEVPADEKIEGSNRLHIQVR